MTLIFWFCAVYSRVRAFSLKVIFPEDVGSASTATPISVMVTYLPYSLDPAFLLLRLLNLDSSFPALTSDILSVWTSTSDELVWLTGLTMRLFLESTCDVMGTNCESYWDS